MRPTLNALALLVLAAEPAVALHVERVSPQPATPGSVVEVEGRDFGHRQGRWQVTMSRIVDHRADRWAMSVLSWSDTRIRARVPAAAPSDRYLVVIVRSDRPTLYSNNVVFSVWRPGEDRTEARYRADGEYERAAVGQHSAVGHGEGTTPPGLPWLQTLKPTTVRAGRSLVLRGRDFGRTQAGRIVAINRGQVNEVRVLSWSNRRVEVFVPADLEPGEYRVLVYYDRSYSTSSNSLTLRIR